MGSWKKRKLSPLLLNTRRKQGSCCPPLRSGQTAGTTATRETGRTEAEAKAMWAGSAEATTTGPTGSSTGGSLETEGATVISMIDTGVTMNDSTVEIMNTTDTETITDNTTGIGRITTTTTNRTETDTTGITTVTKGIGEAPAVFACQP